MCSPLTLSGLTARSCASSLVEKVRDEQAKEERERNEEEANGYGPPRRPKRGYHGKRDLKPRED